MLLLPRKLLHPGGGTPKNSGTYVRPGRFDHGPWRTEIYDFAVMFARKMLLFFGARSKMRMENIKSATLKYQTNCNKACMRSNTVHKGPYFNVKLQNMNSMVKY